MSSVSVSVYIPSSVAGSSDAIRRTMADMAGIAGGATATERVGAWLMKDGTLCTEPITTVSSVVDTASLPLLKSYAIGQAKALKEALSQEAVLVMVENVPDFILV